MAELKNMTVQALRELARKALGRGHSKLKTKSELVAALQAAGRNVSDVAEKAAARVKEATGRAAQAAGKMVEGARVRGRASRERKKERAEERGRAREKQAARSQGKAAPKAPPKAASKAASKAAKNGAVAARLAEARRDEPDADGYFVARVRGEEAVRDAPHPMTESALDEQHAPEPRRAGRRHLAEEDLGDLPWTYADDQLVALPRDPRTLFLYWDHHGDTVRGGFEGLEGGKAQIWVFARDASGGWDRVRVLDFALESRSYYVHDLEPGRAYRAEIHVVDRTGRDRLLPRPSNEMTLPPFGPSPVIADRFMRLLWSEPLTRLLRHVREGGPFPDELRALLANLSDWSRFVGPTLGSGSAGGPGGRPTGPSGGPTASSPSSPWGPWSGSGEGR